jgi:tRNA pseudouridine55 synthase
MDGLLVIDKPIGPTSHDVVTRVRRLTGWTKVGHTGTLDPMATGVLPLVVGRATRLAQFFSASDKVYEAEVRLGWATDTYDAMGTLVNITGLKPCAAADRSGCVAPTPVAPGALAPGAASAFEWPAPDILAALIDRFRGTVMQAPPPFSAKKVEGVRAYALAREGVRVEPREALVTLHDVTVLSCEGDRLRLRMHCSAGFYVRSFAHALGLAAGPGAHLAALRRTRSGDWDLLVAVPLQAIEADPGQAQSRLVPMDRLLASLPAVVVTREGAVRTRHGNDLRPCDVVPGQAAAASGRVRVVDEDGTLLAIGERAGQPGILHPGIVVV